jgi:hypothetical protein
VAYVTEAQVQEWLQQSKYDIQGVDLELEDTAKDAAFSLLERRYNTLVWTNNTNTPAMVLNLITMMTASLILRRAIGEDDEATAYPDWLWNRAYKILEGLASGLLELPGTDPDPGSVEEGVPAFFPTDAATDLWFDDPTAEGAAARAFDMQKVF